MSKSSMSCLESLAAERRNLLEQLVLKPAATVLPSPYTGPSAAQIADAIVAKQRNVVPRSARILGSASQPLPGVLPNTFGRIVHFGRTAGNVSRMTLDGSPANVATATLQVTADFPATDINNVDLSQVRVSSATGADASYVVWEEWL